MAYQPRLDDPHYFKAMALLIGLQLIAVTPKGTLAIRGLMLNEQIPSDVADYLLGEAVTPEEEERARQYAKAMEWDFSGYKKVIGLS